MVKTDKKPGKSWYDMEYKEWLQNKDDTVRKRTENWNFYQEIKSRTTKMGEEYFKELLSGEKGDNPQIA